MNDIFYPKQLNRVRIATHENQCFFAMPFSAQYTNVYDTISIFFEKEGYHCIRVDNNCSASVPIINLILKGIASSQYIIVDISESNANVFYELGITHTVKDAENVFIIKEKEANTPFDIQHLQYISYDKNNLKVLANELIKRLNANEYKNAFKRIISTRQLIKSNELDEFVDYFTSIFAEEKIILFSSLLENNVSNDSDETIVNAIWEYDKVLQSEIRKTTSESYIPTLFRILFEILLPCYRIDEIVKYVDDMLKYVEYSILAENTYLAYKTDLAIKFAESGKLVDITLKWIIEYFQRSKSTKVDLNRYKLEAFLLKTDLSKINEYIINSIFSENRYVREHMADIVGEKKLYIAESNLITQLRREDNEYAVSSIVEALGKIHSDKAIDTFKEWLANNESRLINEKKFFVLKHFRNAIARIDSHITLKEFDNKYFDILVKNNAI